MPETKMAFREAGTGEPLILLHGYAGSVLHWDHVVTGLKNQFHVMIPNLTHLYLDKKPLSFSEQIDVLARFVRLHFPNQKVHLAGISYGGALVWGFGLRYPELVDKTIFINPMPPNPLDYFHLPILKSFFMLPLNRKMIFMLLKTPVGKIFLKSTAKIFRIERADLWEHNKTLTSRKLMVISQIIYRFAHILRNENWNLWVTRIEAWVQPSLLIYDFEDPLFSPKTYHHFQEMIGCDLVEEVHLAGHIAIKTRGPEIAEMMSEFLVEEKKSKVA